MCVHIAIIKIYQVDWYKMIVIHTFHFKLKIFLSSWMLQTHPVGLSKNG